MYRTFKLISMIITKIVELCRIFKAIIVHATIGFYVVIVTVRNLALCSVKFKGMPAVYFYTVLITLSDSLKLVSCMPLNLTVVNTLGTLCEYYLKM